MERESRMNGSQSSTFMRGRLGTADYARDFQVPGLLCAETFRCLRIFQKNFYFRKKNFLFEITFFLFSKKLFFNVFEIFLNNSFFQKKAFFKQKSFILIEMLISSKLFI